MNFAHSKTNSFLNLAANFLGGFQVSNPGLPIRKYVVNGLVGQIGPYYVHTLLVLL